MFELTEIMRQKDDSMFAQLLNRIREGNQTENDLATLESRSISVDDTRYQSLKPELHLFLSMRLLMRIIRTCLKVQSQKKRKSIASIPF